MERSKLRLILKRDPYIRTDRVIRPNHIIDAVNEHFDTASGLDPQLSLERIQKAIAIASSAHEGVLRKNGEPYIVHPLTVAYYLAKMGMDPDCVIVGQIGRAHV